MLTDEQIEYMVDRFLSWRVPDDFSPDGGISFAPLTLHQGAPYQYDRWPVGTNLLNRPQTEKMVRYLLDGLTHDFADCALPDDVVNLVRAARVAAWDDGDINTLADLDEAVSAFDDRVPEDDATAAKEPALGQ